MVLDKIKTEFKFIISIFIPTVRAKSIRNLYQDTIVREIFYFL